jgi:hypothetical protein
VSDLEQRLGAALNGRIDTDPEHVERGLAGLVLMLIDLVREVMERQAVRRIEGGSLTDEEIERLGQTFMRLERRMEELRREFGLDEEDDHGITPRPLPGPALRADP